MAKKCRIIKKAGALLLALCTALSAAGCQSHEEELAEFRSKTMTIGVTGNLSAVNPLVIDASELNHYALGLMFMPLVELNGDLEFEGMLADSVTAQDERNFLVHINQDACWSDGTPITAQDVEYTALRLASPLVANATTMYYVFEGVEDSGFVEEGADHVEGIQAVDEKTVRFTTKDPMSLSTFLNSYARYLLTLPKHVIENIPEEELASHDWFNHPDVVSGPYRMTSYDVSHYVTYQANENFWRGVPKIENLNIQMVDSSQLYTGLMTGEIDAIHPTLSTVPQEDYESIEKLSNVTVTYGAPVTNESVFIQTANLPDPRVRLALLCSIDRERLLSELLDGAGEIVDGFLSSPGPYYDETIQPVEYDPERAKELLEEAGWDSDRELVFCVNSSDTTFVNAAAFIAAGWEEIGVKTKIRTMDFSSLMSITGTTEYDLLGVQYTYAPVDPYSDVAWLLGGEGSWTGYSSDTVNQALSLIQGSDDPEVLTQQYGVIDREMQQQVPMFSAYVLSNIGAVNNRIQGADMDVYGFFNHPENWEIVESE